MKKIILFNIFLSGVLISYSQNMAFTSDSSKVVFKTTADSLFTAVLGFKAEYLFNASDTLQVSFKEVKEESKIFSNVYELPADSVYKLFLPFFTKGSGTGFNSFQLRA